MSMSRGFKRVVFSQSTAAQFELVPAPTNSKKIRVRGLFLSAAAAQDIDIESSTSSVDTSLGIVNLVAGIVALLPIMVGVRSGRSVEGYFGTSCAD